MEINVLKYQELITYRDFLCIDDYKKFINAIIDKYDTCMVFFEDKFKSKHSFSQTANTNLLNLKNHHIISIDTKEKKKEYKEEYRNNIDISFEAIKKSMHNYNYAGEDVKNSKEVLDYIKKKEEELFKDL